MLIADKPTAATRLATEQTDAVMQMALIARRLTTSVSGGSQPPLTQESDLA
jgi:hypothetical protein